MRPKTYQPAALALAALLAAAALPLLAQGPGRPAGPEGAGHPGARLLAKLALYLDLDEAQRAQAEDLFATARAQAEPIRAANRDLAAQLREALAADPPDPAAVGALVVSIHANREQLRGIRETAQADFRALLTSDQQLRLDALRDARRIFGRHLRGRAGAGEPDDEEPGAP